MGKQQSRWPKLMANSVSSLAQCEGQREDSRQVCVYYVEVLVTHKGVSAENGTEDQSHDLHTKPDQHITLCVSVY